MFRFDARQRVACMIAASMADLDGLGILFGEKYYWDYHHKVGHNLFFGLLGSLLLTLWCRRQWIKTFLVCLALFHLHLFLDLWGSGPLWHIHYLWPIANVILKNPRSWDLYSWQNMVVYVCFLIWALWIASRLGRTPIELLVPRIDQAFVRWFRARFPAGKSNT
jgi:inner membrane protein